MCNLLPKTDELLITKEQDPIISVSDIDIGIDNYEWQSCQYS